MATIEVIHKPQLLQNMRSQEILWASVYRMRTKQRYFPFKNQPLMIIL